MLEEVLTNLGLSPEEVDIYLSLLSESPQSAGRLGKTTKVKRTYVYRIVDQLIQKGLAAKAQKGRTTIFTPLSPDNLLTQAETQKQKAARATQTLNNILPTLKERYKSVEDKPAVTYYEGIEGMKKIYKDIINDGKDIILFRSIHDHKYKKLADVVEKQIESQVKKGLKTKAITPLEKYSKYVYTNLDKKRLVDRHIVRKGALEIPAQIIIYGDKTAIATMKKNIFITLIDNKEITDSFKQMFDFLWILTVKEHNKITKDWTKKSGLKEKSVLKDVPGEIYDPDKEKPKKAT